jgi:hypothetical protein
MGRLQPGISDEQARASLAVSLDQAVRSTITAPDDHSVPPLLLLHGGRGWNYAAQELETHDQRIGAGHSMMTVIAVRELKSALLPSSLNLDLAPSSVPGTIEA